MKILIVGAGITGLSCALRLLRMGHRVTVAEKLRGPIDRVCGEGILPFGRKLLAELDLEETVAGAGKRFYGIAYHGVGRQVEARFKDGEHGIGISRGRLDAILRRACQIEAGFTLWEGRRIVPGPVPEFDRVLAADGIRSRWGSAHGRRARFGTRLGLRFRLNVAPPNHVSVHFFRGYEIYLTPVGPNELSVAMLIDPVRSRMSGARLTDRCITRFREAFPQWRDLEVKDPATRGPISARPEGRPDMHLLGDAYRAFDPISGAGMSFGMLCAKMAALHLDDPRAYYASLKPALRSITCTTEAVLFFRGGGFRTGLMMRQLAGAPVTFQHLLALHDGRRHLGHLGLPALLPLLRPW
ncbi:MAG: FAD-dependent oxidoreductase [Acidobacteriota bacterium]|nr:FAD-dependent oxidoreductase [Acidobacteriota bacterium]